MNPLDGRGESVERQFHKRMVGVYEHARDEAGYVATRFIQMVADQGGVAAARQLLHGPPSDGFTALWERGRLDLTVEALILDPAFTDLSPTRSAPSPATVSNSTATDHRADGVHLLR